jgi:hypothetical protein
MTDVITMPAGLRGLTDDQLAEAWDTADVDNPAVFAQFQAEFDYRERAERMAKAREAADAILAEGYDAAFAQHLEASAWCRGSLLSDLGKRKVTDEMSLWTGSEATAMRYASEELRDFWMFVQPRVSPGKYARQRSEGMRIGREEWQDRHDINSEGNTDDHDHGDGRPGLAGDAPGAFRRDETPEETPESGSGGTVDSTGPATSPDHDTDTSGGSGSGGPVRPVTREDSDDEPEPEPLLEATDEQHEPGDLKFILEETAAFVGRYISATPGQVTAMTLYAAATYALQAFPTFGRLLFTSEREASGKTVAMMITAALAANPLDASGTTYALQSALASASNAPEQLTPTLYLDEVSEVFGRSGLVASRNPVAEILRKGYKAGATRAWSVNRSAEKYGIYTPFLMAGLRNAVPRDIRSRCIPLVMVPGTPREYFDAREAEPDAAALADCLGQAVASRMPEIKGFRAKQVRHPKLRDRLLEVWEPLFAVAHVLGGQEWLNKCLEAFKEIALADAGPVSLSPRQQILCDAVAMLDGPLAGEGGRGFVGGESLADEMRRLPDRPSYEVRSLLGMCKLIAEAMPVKPKQVRVGDEVVRGYFPQQVRDAWDAVRPAEAEDATLTEEPNPFAVTDEDAEDLPLTCGVTDDSLVTDVPALVLDQRPHVM